MDKKKKTVKTQKKQEKMAERSKREGWEGHETWKTPTKEGEQGGKVDSGILSPHRRGNETLKTDKDSKGGVKRVCVKYNFSTEGPGKLVSVLRNLKGK